MRDNNNRSTFLRKSLLYVVLALCAAGTGGALLYASQEVREAEARLARLHRATAQEREAIHVLEAEWSFLNRPERLERLAAERLDMDPPVPKTLVHSVASLPEPLKPVLPVVKPAYLPAPRPAAQPSPTPAASSSQASFRSLLNKLSSGETETGGGPHVP